MRGRPHRAPTPIAATPAPGIPLARTFAVACVSGSLATFTAVYRGWYSGRAVHIHFKVRTNPASSSRSEFTSPPNAAGVQL